jgi:hypothetical protein
MGHADEAARSALPRRAAAPPVASRRRFAGRRDVDAMNRLPRHPVAQQAAILGAFAVVTVALTWPLALHMADHVIGAMYYWDAYTNTMLMGARARGLLGIGPGGIYENYFFAPITDTIAFNENLFGLSLLFLPFYLLGGNPLLAYNAVLLLSLVLSGYFTFLLVRRLSGSGPAGFLAGVAFAFCPYAAFEIGRIQLVATQWIPLFFLFLHRAFEERRLRDVIGVGVSYALQVGTCLYYAMFMLPLAAVMGGLLLWRSRPLPRRFLLQLGAVGALTFAVVAAMIFPYFGTRRRFSLIRTEDFAQDFDGKLSFLLNVHPTNKLLTFLHHVPETAVGAHEEIAFPGFTIALLAALSLAGALATGFARQPQGATRKLLIAFPICLVLGAACAWFATIAAHDFAAGMAVVIVAGVLWHRFTPGAPLLRGPIELWIWMLPLTLVLFLGIAPFEHGDRAVRGLYYYLHTYVPGFNGIRKVSRQAILTTFCFALLAGLGAAMVLGKLRPWPRNALFALLLGLVLAEFNTAPVVIVAVPAGDGVPRAYRHIARQPGAAPIGILPAHWGKHRFSGQRGLAIHNYLALYHGRRTLNGKSSWIPPITHLFHRAARRLPNESAIRVLQILAPQFLVVHGTDMDRKLYDQVVAGLEQRPEIFRRTFVDQLDRVYRVVGTDDPSLGLLPTPELAVHLRRVPPLGVGMAASRNARQTHHALDGNPNSRWATHRSQWPGDWVEFVMQDRRTIAAIEFSDFDEVFDAPLAFKIEASEDGVTYRKLFERPRLRIFTDQIHRPTEFVFRLVLPQPVRTYRLRMTLLEGVPGRWWSIHEARLWELTTAAAGG